MSTMTRPSLHQGYSDERLEELSHLQERFEAGVAPWIHWESENSSFGKTLRKWAFYPSWLPIYASSDHGVHWESRCWPNELDAKSEVFFTWNSKKNRLMRTLHNKRSYHIPHPWVYYRKKNFSQASSERRGTLAFFAHSNANTTPNYVDLDTYMDSLRALPDKYQPVVLCLSFHDIAKGLHKTLRKYGFPIITAGTTNSQKFVDRFYSMIMQFNYATSANVGSHTFYILEAGVPFFLMGDNPEYHIQGSKSVRDGKQNLLDYGDLEDIQKLHRFRKVLAVPTDQVTAEQKAMVVTYMGLDSTTSRVRASLILWGALASHFSEFITTYTARLRRLMCKIFLNFN